MRRISRFALIILSCATLSAPVVAQTTPAAAPPPVIIDAPLPIAPEHLQAVTEMLTAMKVGDLTMAGMRMAPSKNPQQREFASYLLAHIQSDDVVRVFAPVYASYVPLAKARELNAAFRRPQAQRAIDAQLDTFTPPGTPRRFKPQEAQALAAAFDGTAEGKQYSAVAKAGLQSANAALVRWVADYHDRLMMTPLQAIAADRAAWIASGMTKEPVPFTPAKVGVSYMDDFATLVAASGNRSLFSTWKLERDMATLKFGGIMTPNKLIVPANMARARSVIDDGEKSLETFLAESESNMTAFRAALETLPMPGAQGSNSPFARALEQQMGRSVKFAENQRTMVALMRRLIDYVEARKKTLQVKNDTFLFASDADVAGFNELVAALQREVALGESIWKQTQTDLDKAAKGAL